MTLDDVKDQVAYIKDLQGDPELAHSAEDELYEAILIAIRDDTMICSPRAAAEIALETKQMDFPRWCA